MQQNQYQSGKNNCRQVFLGGENWGREREVEEWQNEGLRKGDKLCKSSDKLNPGVPTGQVLLLIHPIEIIATNSTCCCDHNTYLSNQDHIFPVRRTKGKRVLSLNRKGAPGVCRRLLCKDSAEGKFPQ